MTARDPAGPEPFQPRESDRALVANVMHFARALRGAGMPIGPGQVLAAVNAIETVGITSRPDFYWTLHAVFVTRREHRDIFDQAFHVFWRNPRLLEQMMSLLLPPTPGAAEREPNPMNRRLAEALRAADRAERPAQEPPPPTLDAAMTWSNREVLQAMDFEHMSLEEMRAAKAIIARLVLPLGEVPTRRFGLHPSGDSVDPGATLRSALRSGGDIIPLRFRRRRLKPPPLVVLCDISGSMGRYTRLFLHFLHALTRARTRVHTFLFGTRLTNITRQLRHRDVDRALDAITHAVEDWAGGTRIGACLREFNLRWARRTLAQGAVVLLISDGLDRDAGAGVAAEMTRLHRSCRRLIWLNPLLRYAGFEPKSLGMQAMLPHVDDFRPAHNLESLAQLAKILAGDQTLRIPRKLEAHAA